MYHPLLNTFMPVRANISVLDAFRAVFDHCQKGGAHLQGGVPAHRFLMDYYDLTMGAVDAIAYLLHYRPTEISESRLRVFPNNRNESSVTVFENLKSRGIIEERRKVGLYGTCFSITEAAYKAFQDDRKISEPAFKDCLEELRTGEIRKIFSPKWLGRFVRSFEVPENAQFKAASQELALSELSQKDQMVFWAVARFFLHHFADVFCLEDDDIDSNAVADGLGRLAKAGLVILLPSEEDSNAKSEYVLAPKAAGLLFHGHDELLKYDEVSKYADIIKCRDIEKKELFFSADAQSEIDNLRTMISKRGFVRAKNILIKKKRAQSIHSLLWGPPGTGKTETVRQLALESGRDIIQFDMAKVTGYGWGATEKYYRALFRSYNYIAAISDNVPIFLLNEADDILSKRLTHVERAIDKSENTVANILLQEIENLNGILLATTNLIDNLDPAFDRRFLFKTRLEKPDADAQAKIWMSNIPELTAEEAKRLTSRFDMSGAQINNVVVKRDLAELYYDGDRGYSYIAGLCEKELATENGSRSTCSRIGF